MVGDGVEIEWLKAAAGMAGGFAVVSVLIWLLNPLARRIGLVDHPGGRKDHHSPTPVTGGLAIALGTIIPGLIIAEAEPAVVGLGLAALVLTIVGVLDDLFDLRWYVRLVAQVAAAAIIVVVGGVKVAYIGPVLGLHETALNELSVPFTILATVGLINALNMIDGIDGLAGAMALCALAMLGAASIYAGNLELTNGLAVMIGAVGGFLAFNMRTPWRRRAAVFLGNSGSAYLGLVMAWCAFRLTQNPGHPVSPVLAPFLIAPPVIDCLVLMFRRLLHRKSPFAADRTHIHHLLLDAGFSVTGVVLALSVFSLLLGLAAGLARLADVPPPAFVVAYIAITVGYFFWSMKPARAAAMLRQLLRPGRAAPTVAEPSSSEA